MGQQQLLLIVLGAIIVGMSIYGGLRVMESFNQDSERDQLMVQMQSIASDARTYAAKPSYLGGGAGTFTGFSPPQNMTTTERFRIYPGVNPNILALTGYGSVTGTDGANPVQIILLFDLAANQVTAEEIN